MHLTATSTDGPAPSGYFSLRTKQFPAGYAHHALIQANGKPIGLYFFFSTPRQRDLARAAAQEAGADLARRAAASVVASEWSRGGITERWIHGSNGAVREVYL